MLFLLFVQDIGHAPEATTQHGQEIANDFEMLLPHRKSGSVGKLVGLRLSVALMHNEVQRALAPLKPRIGKDAYEYSCDKLQP